MGEQLAAVLRKQQDRIRSDREGEVARMSEVRARGAVPEACRPGVIPEAPARGPVALYRETEVVPQADGTTRVQDRNHHGFAALRRADAFDVMEAQARRAHRGDAAAFAPPFTPGQVAMGRHYAAVFERHAGGGIKCSSVEGRVGGDGRGGDFMDRLLEDRRTLDALIRRIGSGVALSIRRVRPSSRGTRRAITDRALVDGVCLAGQTVTDVLRAHGWADKGDTRKAARGALAAALDRMAGPVSSGRIRAAHLGGAETRTTKKGVDG